MMSEWEYKHFREIHNKLENMIISKLSNPLEEIKGTDDIYLEVGEFEQIFRLLVQLETVQERRPSLNNGYSNGHLMCGYANGHGVFTINIWRIPPLPEVNEIVGTTNAGQIH